MTDFIEIPGWEDFLPAVRDDRITEHWRPRFIVLPVADMANELAELTDADAGFFVKLLLEHASAPLRDGDDEDGPRGARRLTRKRAMHVEAFASRSDDALRASRSRSLRRLKSRGLIDFVPDKSGTSPAQTRRDKTSRDETKSRPSSEGGTAVDNGRPEPGPQEDVPVDREQEGDSERSRRSRRGAKSESTWREVAAGRAEYERTDDDDF